MFLLGNLPIQCNIRCNQPASSCIWRFPSEFDALFIAKGRAQSRHMNHSRWSIVKQWHTSTIQQRDKARNSTKCSRNFWATVSSSSIGPWAER